MLGEVPVTYKDLKDIIVLEHFSNFADKDMRAENVRYKNFSGLKETATWADDRVVSGSA